MCKVLANSTKLCYTILQGDSRCSLIDFVPEERRMRKPIRIMLLTACTVSCIVFALICILVVWGVVDLFATNHKCYTITQGAEEIECIRVRYVDWEEEKIFDWGEIPPENHREFISELSQLVMSDHSPPTTGVEGLTYQIEYVNGEYEMISLCVSYSSATDSENGRWHFEKDEFYALWEAYGMEFDAIQEGKY